MRRSLLSMKHSKRSFIAVLGDGSQVNREDGAASILKGLGAKIKTFSLWDFPNFSLEEEILTTIVIEVLGRPDLVSKIIHSLKKNADMEGIGVLVAVSSKQVAQLDPSSGFDDFVLEPYVPAELYSRIRKIEWLRSEFSSEERIKIGSIVIDKVAHEIQVRGQPISLTTKEFALLCALCENRGKVLSRHQLIKRVWGSNYEGGYRTVDIHIRRLRSKFGSHLPLQTLRGSGYKVLL